MVSYLKNTLGLCENSQIFLKGRKEERSGVMGSVRHLDHFSNPLKNSRTHHKLENNQQTNTA